MAFYIPDRARGSSLAFSSLRRVSGTHSNQLQNRGFAVLTERDIVRPFFILVSVRPLDNLDALQFFHQRLGKMRIFALEEMLYLINQKVSFTRLLDWYLVFW